MSSSGNLNQKHDFDFDLNIFSKIRNLNFLVFEVDTMWIKA